MQCPRCSDEVADGCTRCPTCHKQLTGDGRGIIRTALTGDAYESPIPASPPPNHPFEVGDPAEPPPLLDETTPVAVRLIPTHADLLPAARRAVKSRPLASPQDPLRWGIVAVSVVGVVASLILWRWTYVAPVHLSLQGAGQNLLELNEGGERAIPAVYLCLWGVYGLLAVATQFFLPAPWRVGEFQLRTNWVLNITTLVTLIIFFGAPANERADDLLGREAITFQGENGQQRTYVYQRGAESRTISAEEARQINESRVWRQESAIFKTWNMTAALAYLALGAYAVWWIIERPEANNPRPALDVREWIREARGEKEPATLDGSETLPSENTRWREPTAGDSHWR